MMPEIDQVCPMFNTFCRHLSHEHTLRPCTEIKKDVTSGIYKPVKETSRKAYLGPFCNEAGKWVEEMHYCPVKWGNANHPAFHPSGEKRKRGRPKRGSS